MRFKDQILNIRLIEGQYPNYKAFFSDFKDSSVKKIKVSTQEFLEALSRISVMTTASFKGVDFTFSKNKLFMEFAHADQGEASEELDCEYGGGELKVRFNSHYVIDAFRAIHDKKTEIQIKNSKTPGLIKSTDDSACLIMPMKL